MSDIARCEFCAGLGMFADRKCEHCAGQGFRVVIPKDDKPDRGRRRKLSTACLELQPTSRNYQTRRPQY
jgi:hypothetical protein